MAVATTMYYTGIDPLSMEPVYSAKELREKRMMKALIFYWDAEHHELAREALIKLGRRDLIGRTPNCLVPPESAKDRLLLADRVHREQTMGGAPTTPGRPRRGRPGGRGPTAPSPRRPR